MKRIYVVSIDDEVPLSDKLADGIKVLAFLLYDEIRGYEYEDCQILCHDDIIYNELLEKKENDNKYIHRFTHNDVESGMYEPFMINDRSFAFTVIDGTISDAEIKGIIDRLRLFSKVNCSLNIHSVTYEDDKKKNRLLAIKKILLDSEKKNKKEGKVKIKSLLPVIGLIIR